MLSPLPEAPRPEGAAARAAGTAEARRTWWRAPRSGQLKNRLVTAGCVVGLYYLTSHLTSARHVELESWLDRAIPFIPETAWVYFPCYMLQFLLGVFGIRSRGAYYGAVRSILFSAAICLVVFLLVPSTMAWPPLPVEDSVTRELLVVVRTLDVPNNTFPSLHVALSFCVALGALRFRRWFGVGLLLMSCVIFMSTITAKHHYVVDSPEAWRWRRWPTGWRFGCVAASPTPRRSVHARPAIERGIAAFAAGIEGAAVRGVGQGFAL